MGSPSSNSLAVEILAVLATMPTTTPPLDLVVAELGSEPARLAVILARLERSGLIESWPDPVRPGSTRLMLSVRSMVHLGLRLSPEEDRWERPAQEPWPTRLGPLRRRRRGSGPNSLNS